MYRLLKKYNEANTEKFNEEFILSRENDDFMTPIIDIIKSVEIIDEIKITDIRLETDESQFGPMKNYGEMINGNIAELEVEKSSYKKGHKPLYRGRHNKIIFTAQITPSMEITPEPILADEKRKKNHVVNAETYTITKELYINKLVDKYFFENDDIKYFLIYQLTDKSFYRVNNAICLKSLLMPITMKYTESILEPEYAKHPITARDHEAILFKRKVNPIYYMIVKEAYNSLIKIEASPNEIIDARLNHRDSHMFDWVNKFFNTDLKFSDNMEDLVEEGRLIFQVKCGKNTGMCLSVNEEQMRNDITIQSLVSALVNLKRGETKKKKCEVYSLDDFHSPWFWIDFMASYFCKSPDYIKRFEKVRGVLYSAERLLGEGDQKTLPIEPEHKQNILTIFKYMMNNFDSILYADTKHIKLKKIRFWEPLLVGLQIYFSDHIFRIFNSTTRSKMVLDRLFGGLKKNYIITSTSTNELFRYHNASNSIMDLFTVGLKCSKQGAQGLGKVAGSDHKDLHDSYFGRLSLSFGSPSTAGLVTTINPMIDLEDDLRSFKLDKNGN